MKRLAHLFAAFWSERSLILLFCLGAALRVFVFAAAFPFFSNVDEEMHFDLVNQYAAGRPPRTFDVLKPESLDFIALYGSPEFLQTPDRFPDAKFPPPLWKQPAAEAAPVIEATKEAWRTEVNWESSQPPLYYVIAGLWWKFGQRLGLAGIESLYWIRFLNGLLMAAVVWLGYVIARMVAPELPGMRIGVPLLLAFIPQDVFYVISNDVLSPIAFGAVFLCALKWLQASPPSLRLAAGTGFAIAATYLTKLSNLPLLAIALIAIFIRSLMMIRQQPARAWLALFCLLLCAGIPIGGWMIWSQAHFVDITGSAPKILILGWTRKPLAEWWQHPIFSLQGLWTFWSELVASLWRGELVWEHQQLNSRIADKFYALSSLLFLCLAVPGIRSGPGRLVLQGEAIWLAVFALVSAFAFFVLLSIEFDFGQCVYPSRAHPYFTSGRLLSGALIPFALLYAAGVSRLLRGTTHAWPTLVLLALIAVGTTLSEIAVRHAVFASEHNWYHLP